MASANVQLVSRGWKAVNAGGIEAVLPFFAEDVLIYPTSEWPDGQVYRDHDGFRRLYHAWVDHFEDWTWEVQEIRDAGDQVVSLVEMRGRLRDAGTPICEAWGVIYSDFCDGRIGKARWFRSQRQALEAAGLADDA
jgi:ketosteroid isomerase-like protein